MLLLLIIAAYLAVGLVVMVLTHSTLTTVDPATKGAGILFRLLVTPGLVLLWPVVFSRWLQARKGKTFARATEATATMATLRAMHAPLLLTSMIIGGALLLWGVVAAQTNSAPGNAPSTAVSADAAPAVPEEVAVEVQP